MGTPPPGLTFDTFAVTRSQPGARRSRPGPHVADKV